MGKTNEGDSQIINFTGKETKEELSDKLDKVITILEREKEGRHTSSEERNGNAVLNTKSVGRPIEPSPLGYAIWRKHKIADLTGKAYGQQSPEYGNALGDFNQLVAQYQYAPNAPDDVRMTHFGNLPPRDMQWGVRAGGVLQAAGGTGQVALGYSTAAAGYASIPLGPEVWPLSAAAIVGGTAVGARGVDNVATGIYVAWNGQQRQSLAADLVDHYFGSDAGKFAHETAEFLDLAALRAAPEMVPSTVPKSSPRSAVLSEGEPVSVANGEYLETWRDFLVPGILPFDGARYMGLKLPDAQRWRNPLGKCQISVFDEYISNPNRGELVLHQADGEAIRFERPFNFLPSVNTAYPHLELTAPWLGQLQLKDRNIKKFFVRYEDGFYRLAWVKDLNDYGLVCHRDNAGVLWCVERSDGLRLILDNDTLGHRTAISLVGVDGSQQLLARYAYDARGRMISTDCSFGMSVRYEWHAKKPLLVRWHNLTKRSETVFAYDAEGRVVHTATSGIWNDDRFVYDSAKRETRYLPGGEEARTQTFAYDEHENITAEVDALGGRVAHRYDKAGFRTATTDANGHEEKTTYDIWGNVKKFTDGEGRRTTYGWGPDGQLDIVIDNLGNKTQYKHDDNSNVILEIDPEGQRTVFERDKHGRIVRTVFADGSEEKRAYGAYGWLDHIVDAQGGVTRFTYDPFGRVVETVNPLGEKTAFEYAAGAGGFDVPTALRRPDGVVVRRAFDQEGALASVTDGEGRTWRYRHGAFDVLEAIEDPRGGVLRLGYDSEGHLTSVTNAMNRVYHLRRDVAGRIIAEGDFDGRLTRYTRDAGGRVTEKIKPDGARLTYAYDKTGLVTRVEAWEAGAQEASEVVRYWYDGRGLLQTAQNRFARVDYIRDKTGRVIEEDCNGRRIKVVYDACGRRVSRRVFSGIDQPHAERTAEHLVEYVRDPLGAIAKMVLNGHEPLSFRRDALGRETRRESAAGFKLDSSYDAAGQLMRQEAGRSLGGTYEAMREAQLIGLRPDAMRQVDRSYGWDKALAPTSIKDGIWGETAFSYDRNGQVSEATFANGTGEKFSYDAARNVAGVQAIESNGVLGDGLGQFLNWISTPGGAVQVARGPKGEKITLHHDSCGRVIERIVERDGFRPKRWRYEWDVFDRLVGCLTPDNERWVFTYDPFGRRISKVRKFTEPELAWLQQKFPAVLEGRELPVDRGAWQIEPQHPKNVAAIDSRPPIVGTWYSWDGDVLCEEAPLRLDGKVDWVLATRWYFEEGTFIPVAKEDMGGELSYIITDHLGTPREMFSQEGTLRWAASFTTWGVVRGVKVPVPEAANDDTLSGPDGIGSSGLRTHGNLALKPALEEAVYDCPIRFQGQWQDEETGLYYNRHRYYDPLTTQYMSLDPIGMEGGDRPRGYVARPHIWSDPLGLSQQFNYRGYHANHPELKNAEKGLIRPGDPKGNVTPQEHNLGQPADISARSPYTSWTTERSIAVEQAKKQGPGGLVVKVPRQAPPKNATWKWEYSDDIFMENEILLKGTRRDAIPDGRY